MSPTYFDIRAHLETYIPKYLLPEQQAQLFEEIRRFPEDIDYFLRAEEAAKGQALQGDSWAGMAIFDVRKQLSETVTGLIISNSCDIDPNNAAARPRNVLFCPMLGLAKYEEILAGEGRKPNQINSTLEAIRNQEATYTFYLPELEGSLPETVTPLDSIYIQPLESFDLSQHTFRARLSQIGFYVLVIKLAIHFTRVGEGVRRFDSAGTN